MKRKLVVLALFLVGAFPTVALTDDTIARFQGGIGVLPVSSVAGTTVNQNIVRGVNPAGQPWVIADLSATVSLDGRITVDGKGLLLAGGNNIGFTANLRVFATLICGAAAPFTLHSSNLAGVALEANGDFRINDFLSPLPPMACASPVLLIRNTLPPQAWFAAGIPKLP
jgi:hypothetical protein